MVQSGLTYGGDHPTMGLKYGVAIGCKGYMLHWAHRSKWNTFDRCVEYV